METEEPHITEIWKKHKILCFCIDSQDRINTFSTALKDVKFSKFERKKGDVSCTICDGAKSIWYDLTPDIANPCNLLSSDAVDTIIGLGTFPETGEKRGAPITFRYSIKDRKFMFDVHEAVDLKASLELNLERSELWREANFGEKRTLERSELWDFKISEHFKNGKWVTPLSIIIHKGGELYSFGKDDLVIVYTTDCIYSYNLHWLKSKFCISCFFEIEKKCINHLHKSWTNIMKKNMDQQREWNN